MFTVVDEIALGPEVANQPTAFVLARGNGWEIVRTTAYYDRRTGRFGPYRVRCPATVTFKAIGGDLAGGMILWEGSYAAKKLQDCDALDDIAQRMGVSPLDLLAHIVRGRTVLFDRTHSQVPVEDSI